MTLQKEIIVDLINRFSKDSADYLNEMILTFENLRQKINAEGLTSDSGRLSLQINKRYAESLQTHLVRFRTEVTRVGISNPDEYSEEERFAIINVEINMLESLVSAYKNLSDMLLSQAGE